MLWVTKLLGDKGIVLRFGCVTMWQCQLQLDIDVDGPSCDDRTPGEMQKKNVHTKVELVSGCVLDCTQAY